VVIKTCLDSTDHQNQWVSTELNRMSVHRLRIFKTHHHSRMDLGLPHKKIRAAPSTYLPESLLQNAIVYVSVS